MKKQKHFSDFYKNFQVDYWLYKLAFLKNSIDERIPADWFDTWESAWAEIQRLTDDFISNYVYTGSIEGRG